MSLHGKGLMIEFVYETFPFMLLLLFVSVIRLKLDALMHGQE